MSRNLKRRMERLEAFFPPAVEPLMRKIRFISPVDMSVTKTLLLGPNGLRTWTDLTDANNPRTWIEQDAKRN